ncbi:MAG: 3-deoxy-manno-octulosonate cytidylyltransferase [Bdellovibrionales bacterium]
MSTLIIIPARMGSTRFPGKPMAQIRGVPMIGHIYLRTKLAKTESEVCVATCDKEIFDYIQSIGGKAVMTSDAHERCTDRTKEALLKVEAEMGHKVDVVVMVQGDEPLVVPAMVDEVVSPLLQDSKCLVTNLIAPIHTEEDFRSRNNVKIVFDKNMRALYCSREPIPSPLLAKKPYAKWKQLGIIAFRRDFLIQYSELEPTPLEIIESVDMNRVLEHGYQIQLVPTQFELVSVDTKEDLEKASARMASDELFKSYEVSI